MLKMLLSRSGAEIDLAENGQEAVTKVQQRLDNDEYNLGGYDIVFMDNLMPVMVGYLTYCDDNSGSSSNSSSGGSKFSSRNSSNSSCGGSKFSSRNSSSRSISGS